VHCLDVLPHIFLYGGQAEKVEEGDGKATSDNKLAQKVPMFGHVVRRQPLQQMSCVFALGVG
jgi:hypothetical protein